MLNHVTLRGYVADEPFVRATEGGKFVRLRMVTIEKIYIQKNGMMRHHTEWHTVSLWGREAAVADQEIHIGTAIQIEGALRTREWEDKEGITRKTTEISANKLEILTAIEGYNIPQYIEESMAKPRSTSSPTKLEVKCPADDPDELPF